MELVKSSSSDEVKVNFDETKHCLINVGSRKSRLAMIQTNSVIEKLKLFYLNNPDRLEKLLIKHDKTSSKLEFNVCSMTTTGDRVLNKPLPKIGTKSLFTGELEIELLQKRVDFVVHSLKDLPTTIPDGCVIGAVLKRDDRDDTMILKNSLRSRMHPLDLLLGRGAFLQDNGSKFKIGTSSQRRIAMIKRCNPQLECIDIRGNLDTRLAKLDNEEGEYAAIILARAGLDRMGWSDRASSSLNSQIDKDLIDWYYAVGQGAIAVECRSDDSYILDILSPIVDIRTTYEVIAERSLMRKLEGGCSVPLGVRTTWLRDDSLEGRECINLESIVLALDGTTVVKANGRSKLLTNKIGDSTKTSVDVDAEYKPPTGITLSKNFLSSEIRQNTIECQNLGFEVANKMIELGCLKLMNTRE